MMRRSAPLAGVILSVGDELTLGQIVDTNAAWLSARLAEQGIPVLYHKTVPDDLEAVVCALREAAGNAAFVLVTGGLGPTPDDLTREALARAAGVPLQTDPESAKQIDAFFRKLGRPMPSANQVQALCPAGAQMLDNTCGTAPGIRMRLGDATVVAMPGVPHEMKAMFARHVEPHLQAGGGRAIRTQTVHTFGLGESAVAEKLGDLMRRDRNPLVGTTVSCGVVSVRIRSEFANAETAQRELDAASREVQRRLEDAVFGFGEDTLGTAVAALLDRTRVSLALVEAGTAAIVARLLLAAPPAREWVLSTATLGGPEAEETPTEARALRMAQNAARRADARIGLAVIGTPFPESPTVGTGPGTVGEMTVALADLRANPPRETCATFRFSGDRSFFEQRSAHAALNILRLHLLAFRTRNTDKTGTVPKA